MSTTARTPCNGWTKRLTAGGWREGSSTTAIVDATVHDALKRELAPLINALPIGGPAGPKAIIGPLMTKKTADGVIERAKAEGARKVIGGEVMGSVAAHLLMDVKADHELSNVEISGAVLPVGSVSGEAEALTPANNTEFGLASAVFSGEIGRAERFADGIEAGMTNINYQTVQTDILGPFGGEKSSELGHRNGQWIIEKFT